MTTLNRLDGLTKRVIEEPKDTKMIRCLHGNVNKDWCSLCNGTSEKKTTEYAIYKRERQEASEEKALYDSLKARFENFGEDWETEEYEILYNQLEGVSKKALYRKLMYKVSITLGRTRRAVGWKYQYIFGKRAIDLKAGQNLIRFLLKKEGVEFKGVQLGTKTIEGLMLFDNHYGSTIALKISAFTIEAAVEKVKKSDAEWKGESNV